MKTKEYRIRITAEDEAHKQIRPKISEFAESLNNPEINQEFYTQEIILSYRV